jgi:hypothetical protein
MKDQKKQAGKQVQQDQQQQQQKHQQQKAQQTQAPKKAGKPGVFHEQERIETRMTD